VERHGSLGTASVQRCDSDSDVVPGALQELVHSRSIAAHYGKITTMKLLLIVGGCICALASLWGAVAICGTWFIVPRDQSMTAAHDILMRLAYTAHVHHGVSGVRRLLAVGVQENRNPT
jgi:hypothetical protein